MKLTAATILLSTLIGSTSAFTTPTSFFGVAQQHQQSKRVSSSSSSSLSMVLEKPKKLSKLEILKTKSDHLTNPLKEVG
jgi:hypothetical protein